MQGGYQYGRGGGGRRGQPPASQSQQYNPSFDFQPPLPQPQQGFQSFGFENPNLLLRNLVQLAAHNPYLFNPNFSAQNFHSPLQYPNNLPIQQPQNFVPDNNFHGQPQNAAPGPSQSQHCDSAPSQKQTAAHSIPPDTSNNTLNNRSSDVVVVSKQNALVDRPKFPRARPSSTPARKVTLERIELAVAKACRDLTAAKEHVSAWKVSQAVLVELQVDSWDSLGFQLQEVPSLHRLILIEGKINAFIHCYVAVSRIITLYDIEAAISSNEDVENFEELGLGPLVRHPLVAHYFSIKSDVMDVYKITSEEIVSYLIEFVSRGRRFKVEGFLEYIAKKHEVMQWERMGLRIHSLGMYINRIREAQTWNESVLTKCLEKVKDGFGKKSWSSKKKGKRPLFAFEKKQLDERFNAMTDRITTFSSMDKGFCGKHIRFNSSDSEDKNHDMDNFSEEDGCSDGQEHCQFKTPNLKRDQGSTCPYPSLAEEMRRLGVKGEMHSSGNSSKRKGSEERSRKKRKLERSEENNEKITEQVKVPSFLNSLDLSLDNDSLQIFATTWKEACQHQPASEILVRMFECYKPRRRLDLFLSSYPFLGLFNAAVKCLKSETWDSMYDTLQSIGDLGQPINSCIDSEKLDVGLAEKGQGGILSQVSGHGLCVDVEDIMKKVGEYFMLEKAACSGRNSFVDRLLAFSLKLCNCEVWLAKQFSVKDFASLGHGEYFAFIGRHNSLLPEELLEFVNANFCHGLSVEASMLQQQLVTLLSQASVSLWEDESLTTQKISDLLVRQFPQISFKVTENGSVKDLQKVIKKQSSGIPSNCIMFSAALLGHPGNIDLVNSDAKNISKSNEMLHSVDQLESSQKVRPKDVLEVLLKAPMLSDLNSWSHWDVLYAPTFGPLVLWLIREVNTRDLLCLLTKQGKLIRLDHGATVDSFFQALINGSSFQVAVKLLSVLAISGGRRHLPLSLLKCHARQAFQAIMVDGIGVTRIDKDAGSYMSSISRQDFSISNEAASPASRLVLDCLVHLPSEFREFAAEILLSGLQSVVKNAYSAILLQCKHKEERLLIHEVGLYLGIVEWIEDHHAICPLADDTTVPLCSTLDKVSVSEGRRFPSMEESGWCQENLNVLMPGYGPEADGSSKEGSRVPECTLQDDAANIVKSIRQEEFGLDSDLSNEESSVLEKLNARLGRALNCLSRELYSQDSHFLLELVQNADDNVYLRDMEPTLAFIVQDTGIVVLNNEQGFTAQNIRALCDVGNSTKDRSSVGYIGKKGIGFKSVFRVTDAPEIHSNGFHIKFDITEGQIGFVLPTIIPSCNIDLLRRLVSTSPDHVGADCWNTCIVLPFRYKVSESSAVGGIVSMFSDLHPSLLLFLHRLKCIKLRNMLDDSFTVMRKEVMGNGIVKVCHGNEEMTWFVASKKLHSRTFCANGQKTELSVAFTLIDSDDGGYIPYLEQQPVFAFLPLRTYGLKFILQGDFVLPSSREEVDGDSPWNQWLLSEFPGLFVCAEKSFCALPCFRENPGKAVAAYMSFVPLVGEVHGFFSGLPRMIISKLRTTNCLLEDGCKNVWLPPCKFLRNWNEQAIALLPTYLLHEHLGLGFLDRDITIADSLARALGIEEYGPKILVQFISSVCCAENGLKSMDLNWLSCWLNELYNMLAYTSGHNLQSPQMELDLLNNLKKVPFIPLSDGTYSSVDAGPIWVQVDGDNGYEAFPDMYATLRIVTPMLFSVATEGSSEHASLTNNIAKMLQKVGVQQLSAHEIIKVHILPAIFETKVASFDKDLMTEFMAFLMFHLQSSCVNCQTERGDIYSQLRNRAFILTNHGYRRPMEVSIHFGIEYGNSFEGNRLMDAVEYEWLEVDAIYVKHSITLSLSHGLEKWREFFESLGVTDFVKTVQVQKKITDLSPSLLPQVMWDRDLVSPGIMAIDWESEELAYLISLVSKTGNLKRSQYLLEVLDTLWESYFHDKSVGQICAMSAGSNVCFRSSLIICISDSPWVASTVDSELHLPKELFYDCEAVRCILGASAPYAVPTISSTKLVQDIGLKTRVTIDDVLAILQVWRKLKAPFSASVSQMSTLYTFIWNELPASRQKVLEALKSGPFIFVPYVADIKFERITTGAFMAPEELCWQDITGTLDHLKEYKFCSSSTDGTPTKTLCKLYPGLLEFFVNECGVNESPPLSHYLLILKQLSRSHLPLQAAKSVFQVLLKWSEDFICGVLSSDDVNYLEGCLSQLEYTVLPTVQDKWVSLHPSSGLLCWSDNEALKKEFKNLDNIEFLYLGELSNQDNKMLQTKISVLMRTLGISALSEVVSREAIYYGPADSSFKASLMAWALPFAQRYIFNRHRESYDQFKMSGLERLQNLKIVVVEKLFYRNVIKRCQIESKKRHECSSLLEGNVLYATQGSGSHAFFLEFSRLIFDGRPELHLHFANFLHMITTMVESGSSEEQIEHFILECQNIPKLPDEERPWAVENEASLSCAPTDIIEQTSYKSKKRPVTSSWPPVSWKTAPDFSGKRFRMQAATGESYKMESTVASERDMVPTEITDDLMFEDEMVATEDGDTGPTAFPTWLDEPDMVYNQAKSIKDKSLVPVNVVVESHCPEDGPSNSSGRNQDQAIRTGKLGELLAFRYFSNKDGQAVTWVNEDDETGLPYDIVIGSEDSSREYIEVKATRYANKRWSVISTREWQFAAEKGDSYSVAHVALSGKDAARITLYKNPVKLCKLGKLKLAILMPRLQKE